MARSYVKLITILGPLLAVALAGGWIAYTVAQSRLSTVNLDAGLLTQLAEADRVRDDATIDRLLQTGWSAVEPGSDKVALNEPLMLALLEMQIELRRLLGDSFRSEVPVVKTDPACQTDLIEQQLLWLYAAGIATPDGADSGPTTEALARIARQLTCISGLQAAVLDTAMTSSFNTVALRLKERNLELLLPYLARFVAPLQLLILDARKHVGMQSAAWRWFDRWHEVLLGQVGYGGWATDRVFLWDRRFAVLTGFAPCSSGERRPYCVDTTMLLNTINEPRVLGRGNCSFAGMIANGTSWTDTGERYNCSLNYCPDRKRHQSKQPPTDSEMKYLKTLWPGHIQEEDRKLLTQLCFNTLADRQGAYHDPSYCVERNYGSRAGNPFEHQLACQAPGHDETAAEAEAELTGATETAEAAEVTEVTEAEKTEATETVNPYLTDLLGVPQNPACEMLTVNSQQSLPLQAGCTSPEACQDFAPRLGHAPEIAGSDISGLLADAELAVTLINPSDQGLAGLCTNPAECLTQCTALSQQISRPSSCAVMPDIDPGAQPLTIPAEQLADPLLLTSWQPQSAQSTEDEPGLDESFRFCGIGPSDAIRPATHCGLVVCADGLPATGFDTACSCRSEFGGNFTRELMCKKLRCADGQLPDESCNCYAPVPEPLDTNRNNAPGPL